MKKRFIITLNWVDCITLSGIALTLISMSLALKGWLTLALAMLFLTMLVDSFDGLFARKFGLTRPFGRYLDGFADVLAYLIGPGFVLYLWGFDNLFYSLVLIIFITSGIIRLSVFNEVGTMQEEDGMKYLGMPVVWATFITAGAYLLGFIIPLWILFPVLAVGLIVYSIAMVYNATFFKVTNPKILFVSFMSFVLFFIFLHLLGVH
jgi:CDP-diacylglycerol---serine O-phosphatidyltransferase